MADYKISKLQLTNYRNLSSDVITFSDGINCIFGKNGNGKTNILEAIYFLVNRKSFRKNTSFAQLLSFDCDQPEIIFSSVWNGEIPFTGRVSELVSQWYLNNQETKKKLEAKLIFINPFDSFNFMNTSAFRRTWFDAHLSLLDKEFKRNLKRSKDFLNFRNVLLTKKPYHYIEQIAAIDKELAQSSFEVIKFKKKILSELSPIIGEKFGKIFSENHDLNIELDSSFSDLSADEIFGILQENLEKDLIIGHTQKGIHRDDYIFKFDGLNAYEFCSLGQQKMSYLSLLFAFIDLFRYIFNSYPIVLIDDVSGELDQIRWSRLISYLENSKFQVLISTANEQFKEELEKINGANKIYVSNGNIHTN